MSQDEENVEDWKDCTEVKNVPNLYSFRLVRAISVRLRCLQRSSCWCQMMNLTSSEVKDDLVFDRAIIAAVKGPSLQGLKKSNKWKLDTADQFRERRKELLKLLDNLDSTERKKKTLKAICERRSWKATDCKECKDVSLEESYPDHVLSHEHIDNLASRNLFISCADFQVLKTVLQYAVWCTKGNDSESCFPFLVGKQKPESKNKPVTKDLLDKTYLGSYRSVLKRFKNASFDKSMEWAWKLTFNNEYKTIKCPTCNVLLDSSYNFVVHVLLDGHIEKVLGSGKYFHQRDIDFLHDLVFIAKNLHSRVDDADPVLIDDRNVILPPFLNSRSPEDVPVADRINLSEMLKFADQAEFEVPLMVIAKQLAMQDYKVRHIKCTTCSVYFTTKQTLFYHLMSAEHLTKVLHWKQNELFLFAAALIHFYLNKWRSALKFTSEKAWIWAFSIMFPEHKTEFCSVCDIDLSTASGYIKHVRSTEHLDKIFEKNSIDNRDLAAMEGLVNLAKSLHHTDEDTKPVSTEKGISKMSQDEESAEDCGEFTEVISKSNKRKITMPSKKFLLVPNDEFSSEVKNDLVFDRTIVAAVKGPSLQGLKKSNKWKLDSDKQFPELRGELLKLLDNLNSTERKKRTLNAICERRSWKATNCKECKDVSVDESYPDHVLSNKHIDNLASKNLFITCADFQVLKTVLQYAVWCTKGEDSESCFPFLVGKQKPENKNEPVTKDLLDQTYLGFYRSILKRFKNASFNESMEWAWKLTFSNEYKTIKCASCNVLLDTAYNFVVHVLFDGHIEKVLGSGKYFHQRDIDFMHDLVFLAKNLHSRVDDADPVLIDDSNVISPPFLNSRAPKDVPVDGRIYLTEMLRFADQAEFEVPLMVIAKQLAMQDYKVRHIKCTTCSVYFTTKQTLSYHIMSAEHLTKVMNGGLVFSRTLDMDVFNTVAFKASENYKKRVEALGHI